MTSDPVELKGVDVFYGKSQILFGIDLQVRESQTLALLGRNGAGKSTTLKAIMGIVPAAAGRIAVMGSDMTGASPHRIARAGLGYVPEDRQVFAGHTVEDNLLLGAKKGPNDADDWSIGRVFEVFPLLEKLRSRLAGRLSGGEQQMLSIARTLMGNPVALLLDEPSEGLAPIIVQRIAQLLGQLRESQATILIAEQNMHFCLGIASDAVIIDKGQIVYRDSIQKLKGDDAIRRQYLAM